MTTRTQEEAKDEEAPSLMNHEFPDLKNVLEAADVVVEVLDARDPLAFHSEHLEEYVESCKKKMLLVLGKIGSYSTWKLASPFSDNGSQTLALAKPFQPGLRISVLSDQL
jgi:ribosome biogenesis GTPase A